MADKNKVKTRRRINPSIYGLFTGIMLAIVGFGWIHVTNLLNDINGFGLGEMVKFLPYVGVGVVALGIVVFLISIYQTFTKQLIVKETVQSRKKNKQTLEIESSSFEKKHIKGLVFDLDGTLLNTIDDLVDSANYVLQKRGYTIRSLGYCQKALGNGINNFVKQILPDNVDEQVVKEAYQEFLEVYGQRYMMKTKPYEGIVEMFNELVKRGYLLAVVTNKRHEFGVNLIKQHFKEIVFVDVIGEQENLPKKPDPSLLQLVAQEMMISTNQLAMIGDSEIDIQTAHNVNALAIAVSWGFRDEHTLRKENPDYLIELPSEVVMLLDEINKRDVLERPSQIKEEIAII